ncbi:hypothetical protein D7X74_37810 [Corallococcus sp. CA047B]|uniref:hypothetical protein n=1 Tax=Corallococcus sp. CA047B TaxID=2316729 RepID=UPI000EA1FC4C|nr:hypothetical protein [Corallococcus sp. CA047B]RKH01479.1 hypothetical protein D7X74_37810 [Corallococcus sp. CA047B]
MSTPDTTKLEAIRARHAASAEGPWKWFGYSPSKYIELCSRRDTLMAFRRWGMSSAQPFFCTDGLLHRASDLAVPDTDPTRGRITDINHPDARFIAASWQDVKDLLGMVDALASATESARNELATTKEHLQRVHGQVAEVAQKLGAEGPLDGWGLDAAADKVLAERDALRAEVKRLTKAARPFAGWAGTTLNLRPGPDSTIALSFGFNVVQYRQLREFVAAFSGAPAEGAPAAERTEWSTAATPHGCPVGMPCDVCEPEAGR